MLCFLRVCGSMILVFCKFHINTLIINLAGGTFLFQFSFVLVLTSNFLIHDLVYKEVAKNCYFVRFFSSFAKI